jgi:membrane protein YqaA with SNARE-associated domain
MRLFDQLADALLAFGPWGVFLLGMIDSLGVPLPAAMDFWVISAAAKSAANPGFAYFIAFMAVLGSVGGNVGLFMAARHGSKLFQKQEPPPEKRRKFRAWFDRYGLLTVFVPAITPVLPLPMKVFVISAAVMRTPFWRFMTVVLVARVIRYGGEAYLGLMLGADANSFLKRNGLALTGVATAITLVLYLFIRFNERRSAAV